VEREGIKRAWDEVRRADCLLMVIDVCTSEDDRMELGEAIRTALPSNVPMIQVYNKIDQLDSVPKCTPNTVYVSAKSGDGLERLKNNIKEVVGYQVGEGQFLARRRHIQALDTAKDLLKQGALQLTNHRAGELLAEDLRLAHQSLCEITGEFTSDDLLGKIFSSFCIGK